jgi:hypothetical protein
MPALRDDLPAYRRKQDLTGRMGRLHSPAVLLFPALLDWTDDEAGDAHLPYVPRELIKAEGKRQKVKVRKRLKGKREDEESAAHLSLCLILLPFHFFTPCCAALSD